MRRIPLVPMALALMAGIVASHLLPALPPLVWLMLAAAAMLTGGLLTFFSKRGSTVLPFLALTLLFLSLGALRYQLSDYPVKSLPFHTSGETLRMNLLERMQEGPLEHRYAGIAEALTLGWKGDLESDLRLQFRDAGVLHLLCVSGLHVGLLAALVGWVLFFVGKDRRGRIVRGSVQLVTLWGFAALTGMAPATLRAALMFSFFVVGRMLGRRTDSFNLLAAAAIVMLTADPRLLFNVGWQLSFSAVAGILLCRPLLSLHRNLLWRAAIVSLGATLATLPVSLATFHQIHPYFLIANIVIVPLAGLFLVLSLLYLLVPCGVTAWLARWPLMGCDWLTDGIGRLPGAVINDIEPSPWGTAILSVAIIFIIGTINIMVYRFKSTKDDLPC